MSVLACLSDIRSLACDAWLLPSSDPQVYRSDPGTSWPFNLHWLEPLHLGKLNRNEVLVPLDAPFLRLARVDKIPEHLPQPVVCHISVAQQFQQSMLQLFHGTATKQQLQPVVDWLLEGVREWVEFAVQAFKNKKPRNKRHKHLFALPVVGTGAGGGATATGIIVDGLLGLMYEMAARLDVDLVLVCSERPTFARAQRWRMENKLEAWAAELPASLIEEAKILAEHARNQKLVMFLGAGVSIAAGLPSWHSLLETIHREWTEGEPNAQELRENFSQLDPLLKADELAKLRSSNELKFAATNLLKSSHFSLIHALIACLPIKEVITTNYDDLFETACEGVEVAIQYERRPYCLQKLSILPNAPTKDHSRWILKMHGCISEPEKIVLTSQDYKNYLHSNSAALAGIVQAAMMTSHMMFIGFSMGDANYLRIVDSVRNALGDTVTKPSDLGTTIHLIPNALPTPLTQASLPTQSLTPLTLEPSSSPSNLAPNVSSDANQLQPHVVSMIPQISNSEPISFAARRLEIFLDFIAAQTVSLSQFLLDDRFKDALGPDEVLVREHLLHFIETFPQLSDKKTAGIEELNHLLEQLGRKHISVGTTKVPLTSKGGKAACKMQ